MTQPNDGPGSRTYPEALARTVEVAGQRLVLRPVRPQDAPKLVEAVGRCSPDDVRLRFAGGVRRLRLEQAARFAEVDYDRQMGFVAENAAGDILGAARVDLDPKDGAAEYSIMVRSDRQGHGLGGLLLEAVRDYAIGRGAREVWGDVAADNGRMLQLCDELGFRREASDDPGRFRVVWRP